MATQRSAEVAHKGLSQLQGVLLGAGSNAVDVLFGVRGLPNSGSKSYFQSHAAAESVGGEAPMTTARHHSLQENLQGLF